MNQAIAAAVKTEAKAKTTGPIAFAIKHWHGLFVLLPLCALLALDMIYGIGIDAWKNPLLLIVFASLSFELALFFRSKSTPFIAKWIDPSHGYTRINENTWQKVE